jgi:HAE1 family hydrophobic/amphiphilic exporter-1
MYRLALARPTSTLVGAVTLAALGLFSLAKLPVSLLPSVERPRLSVVAKAADRSREEILLGWTEPVERRLGSIPGITSIESRTEDGLARIRIEADWNSDPDALRIDAARRIESAGFPLDELDVRVAGNDLQAIVELAVLGGSSAGERTDFARKVLVPELARLSGAGRIDVLGSRLPRVFVRPRGADLAARGVSPATLADRLAAAGRPSAAGRLRAGAAARPLVVREAIESLEMLGNFPVPSPTAGVGPVPLRQLADVGLAEIGDGTAFRWNGQEGVLVAIRRAPGANAVALAREVRQTLSRRSGREGGGLRVEIAADRSAEVVASLREIGLAALLGLALGTVVLRWTLGRWRPTLALSLVIPASLVSSFGVFHLFGIPLDVVSLGGLALAAGMLVDNSIVVLEAIETKRQQGSSDPAGEGTSQIAVAVVTSCVTTLVVFLPLIYLKGLARAFFGEQAFAVAASLGASLLFSLTLTPVLERKGPAGDDSRRGRSPGLRGYLSLLDRLLERPGRALALGLLFAAASLASVLLLPRRLFPPAEARVLRIPFALSEDLPDEGALRKGRELEETVRKGSGVAATSILLRQGLPDPALRDPDDLPRASFGEIEIACPSPSAARELALRLRNVLGSFPGARCRIAARRSAFTEAFGAGSGVDLTVSAPDPARARALAGRIAGDLVASLRLPSPEPPRPDGPTLFVEWDEPRLARLGTSRGALEPEVRAALLPRDVGRVDIPGFTPEIRLEPVDAAGIGEIPLPVPDKTGNGAASLRLVPLSALARVKPGGSPPATLRIDGRPAARIDLRLASGEGESAQAAALERAAKGIRLAPDEGIRLGGEPLERARAFSELRLALVLSIVLMFLAVAAVYESFLVPLLVLSILPVAAGGGFLLLAATGQGLDLMSFIGLILLGGIVVNHTVVLVDRIEQLRAAGSSEDEAIRGAARERYRPILMTTATTLLGMIPLALVGSEGIELRRPLASAVTGGLVTATFGSLLLVPLLHRLAERWRRRPAAGGGA